MKYAVIRLGGKQFIVKEGDTFEIERQEAPIISEVLLYSDDKETIIGDPVVKDMEVKAVILEDKKDEKIRVARFKSKSRYRKVKGHRQPISEIKIESIGKKGTKAVASEVPTEDKNTKTVKNDEKKVTKTPTRKKTAAKKTTSSKKSTAKKKEDK